MNIIGREPALLKSAFCVLSRFCSTDLQISMAVNILCPEIHAWVGYGANTDNICARISSAKT